MGWNCLDSFRWETVKRLQREFGAYDWFIRLCNDKACTWAYNKWWCKNSCCFASAAMATPCMGLLGGVKLWGYHTHVAFEGMHVSNQALWLHHAWNFLAEVKLLGLHLLLFKDCICQIKPCGYTPMFVWTCVDAWSLVLATCFFAWHGKSNYISRSSPLAE